MPKSCGILAGDVSLKMLAQTLGFKSVIDLDTFESIALPDGEIIAAPFLGEHGDIAHSKTAYALRLGRETVLFAADSTCIDEAVYEGLRRSVGRVGTVFMNTEPEGSPLTFGLDALFPEVPWQQRPRGGPSPRDRRRRARVQLRDGARALADADHRAGAPARLHSYAGVRYSPERGSGAGHRRRAALGPEGDLAGILKLQRSSKS